MTLPSVVHPVGKFPVSMLLSGVAERNEYRQLRWSIQKVFWRIDEHSIVKFEPCEKHKCKLSEGRTIQYVESRQLGNGKVKRGWKNDIEIEGGKILLEFEAQLITSASQQIVCDSELWSCLEVKHDLVIELFVAEEIVNNTTKVVARTGASRLLTMYFALLVTNRAGMGISWDDEVPPLYSHVPPKPPAYDAALADAGQRRNLGYNDLEPAPATECLEGVARSRHICCLIYD
ncbi:Endocytosis regulator [Knufia obscura]|uniref:Endocytosis regulator n=2 Tax=Knufia obscura TaxID=1635080 RepID=A0ABR0R935_9EURO|nr:Endocytosis regulator [Knufia obscura]